MKVCIVIPTHNNAATILRVLSNLKAYALNIIVVNDGSTDGTTELLKKISDVYQVHFPKNRGKGSALQAGFARALELGYTHAITFDADEQHCVEDIPLFLEMIGKEPDVLWVGNRIIPVADSVPMQEYVSFGRRINSFWYRFNTGNTLSDTRCGLRAYPLQTIIRLCCRKRRFEFEQELLIKAAWNGIPVKEIPVHRHCHPRKKRTSRFRPVQDFVAIGAVHAKAAVIRMLLPVSLLEVPDISWKEKIKLLARHELTAHATPKKASLSFAIGVGTAFSPLHGIQILTLIFLCFKLKLNKPLAFLGLNFSCPPLLPFVIAGALATGRAILPDARMVMYMQHLSPKMQNAAGWAIDFIIGSIILTVLGGILAYVATYPLFKQLAKTKFIKRTVKP